MASVTRAIETEAADDDAALVASARADRAAFAALYRRYVDPVFRYCYRRLGSREAAEDATSQTFIRALEALPRFRNGSFRAWLFAIAHNVTANEMRSRAVRAGTPLELAGNLADQQVDVEATAMAAAERSDVRGLLTALSSDDRALLELRLAGLSGAEIAAAVGRSHGAVKVAQFRAMARLRRLINLEST